MVDSPYVAVPCWLIADLRYLYVVSTDRATFCLSLSPATDDELYSKRDVFMSTSVRQRMYDIWQQIRLVIAADRLRCRPCSQLAADWA